MKKIYLFPVLLLSACSSLTAYEGKSASEWYAMYQSALDENASLQYDYDDLQSRYDSLESDHQDLIDCIDYSMPYIPSGSDYSTVIHTATAALDALTKIKDCGSF